MAVGVAVGSAHDHEKSVLVGLFSAKMDFVAWADLEIDVPYRPTVRYRAGTYSTVQERREN